MLLHTPRLSDERLLIPAGTEACMVLEVLEAWEVWEDMEGVPTLRLTADSVAEAMAAACTAHMGLEGMADMEQEACTVSLACMAKALSRA